MIDAIMISVRPSETLSLAILPIDHTQAHARENLGAQNGKTSMFGRSAAKF
jgi:hypothetical protein